MKVKEAIALLVKMNPEADLLYGDDEYDVENVYETTKLIGIATPRPRTIPVVVITGMGC